MFITLEGPEGAGKTTLQSGLARRLEPLRHRVLTTREPGAGGVGGQIRAILLDGEALPSRTELLLFLADRSHHVERIIRPALDEGAVVVCDRYRDSTIVYQGYGRGLDLEEVRRLDAYASGELTPDLTLLLDLDPEIGLARQDETNRLDRESLDFHRRVREGFLAEACREPGRWAILDAAAPAEDVLEDAWAEVVRRL